MFDRLFQLDREQFAKLVVPYLQHCRDSGRISGRVADLDFPDGLVVWFGSDEGAIDIHRGRPFFRRRIKWRPLFPLPVRKHTVTVTSDTALTEMVGSVYDDVA